MLNPHTKFQLLSLIWRGNVRRRTNSKNKKNRAGAMRLKSLNPQKTHPWSPTSLHSKLKLPRLILKEDGGERGRGQN